MKDEKKDVIEMTAIVLEEEEDDDESRVRRSRGLSRDSKNKGKKASRKMILDEQFEIEPMKKVCRFCSVEVVTYVEHEMSKFFASICLASLVVFGPLAVLILPVLFLTTRSAVHRCSRCLQKLGQKKCFGLPHDLS